LTVNRHTLMCSGLIKLLRNFGVLKALCYKPQGRGFEYRWGQWIFQLT
jgi:hypothetical protein